MQDSQRTAAAGVPVYARIDVIGGLVMISLAALVWYGAIGLKTGAITNFGPGAMPRVLAALLFVCGAAVLFRGLARHGDGADRFALALRPPAFLTIAIGLFGLFIRGGDWGLFTTPRLGLAVVGPLAVLIAGFATPEARLKELLVLAFGLTAAALVVFPELLGVPIPVLPGALDARITTGAGAEAALRAVYAGYALLAGALYLAFYGIPDRFRG